MREVWTVTYHPGHIVISVCFSQHQRYQSWRVWCTDFKLQEKDLIAVLCTCVTCGQQRTCCVMQGGDTSCYSSAKCGPCCWPDGSEKVSWKCITSGWALNSFWQKVSPGFSVACFCVCFRTDDSASTFRCMSLCVGSRMQCLLHGTVARLIGTLLYGCHVLVYPSRTHLSNSSLSWTVTFTGPLLMSSFAVIIIQWSSG